MASGNKKRKILVIIIVVIAVLMLASVSYWQYALSRVRDFTDISFSEIKQGNDFIKIRGADIHYVEQGEGDDTIILLHGIGGGAFTFRDNIEVLADNGYRVFAVDLKGFGYSGKVADSDYSHTEQARIVLEFMDKKGIGEAVIAGHSMGGRIALICYDMSPENFEKIILIDSAGLEEDSPAVFSRFLVKPVVDILYYNLFVKEDNFRDFLGSAFYDRDFVDDEVAGSYLEPFRIQDANNAYISILKGNVPYDIASVLEKIDIPVLIVWGKYDNWISLESAYRFRSLIDGSILKIIDKAGHVPMQEQPEPVNQAVLDFIED
jgi:pimeloyl-ACP methyl ester carboxylesterase